MDDTVTATPSTDAQSDAATVSERVIEAVAEANSVSPLDLHPPLFSVVDPEALEAVVASLDSGPDGSDGRIRFTYCGCEVTVTATGAVMVSAAVDE